MFWIKMKFTSSKKNTEILHEYMATNWKPNYWINSKNTEWNEKRLNKKSWNYFWIYMPFLNIRDTVLYERLKSLNEHIKVDEIMKEIEHKNKII